ncbi:hypothetical protein GON09_001296 [Rhodococcus sp. B50]|nr:hypothetical protein [Rhodococcus sp. B50]
MPNSTACRCPRADRRSTATRAGADAARTPDATSSSTHPASDPLRGRDHDATRWFDLLVPVVTGAGRVLMRPHDRRVDADVPGDPADGVGHRLQPGQHLCPGSVTLPATEQPVHRLPGAVAVRHIPPRGADADAPADTVDELTFRPLRWTAGLLDAGQQRSQTRPLRVGEVRSPRYRYAGHEVSEISRFAWSLNPDTGGLTHSTTATLLLTERGSKSLLKHALDARQAQATSTADDAHDQRAHLIVGARQCRNQSDGKPAPPTGCWARMSRIGSTSAVIG